MLKLHVIASGSKGNATVVEDSRTGACVAVDCGISAKQFFAGLQEAGVDPAKIAAMLITHEHTDHTKGLGVVLRGLRKRGVELPVYVDSAVRQASADIRALGDAFAFERLDVGRALALEGIDILPFRTSHDAVSSCGFRFEAGGDAAGFLTDSGIVTPDAHEALSRVRILALEANHDPDMLRTGPYPSWLKARVGGNAGHLSNVQAAEELDLLRWEGLEQVVAMHISENNNTYTLPADTLRDVFGTREGAPQVRAAYQYRSIDVE